MFYVGAPHRCPSSPALTSLPCALVWDAGEGRCPGLCRSPQCRGAGMGGSFSHTTTGNMVCIPVWERGIKELCGWQPEASCSGQVKIPLFRLEGFEQCAILVTLLRLVSQAFSLQTQFELHLRLNYLNHHDLCKNVGQVVAPLQCPWKVWVPRESSFSLPYPHGSETSRWRTIGSQGWSCVRALSSPCPVQGHGKVCQVWCESLLSMARDQSCKARQCSPY